MADEFEVQNVEIVFVKTDPDIIKKLFARLKKECPDTYDDEKKVKALMRYNVWTVGQFCDVSGLKVSTVNNLCRPMFIGGSFELKLDYCYPLRDSGGKGLKMIVRNEKSEKLLKA